MDIAAVVRRSHPGPGGIARALHVTATQLAASHRVRVWAARIDAEPFTRLNTTVRMQRFAPLTADGVEILPLPRTPLAAAPIALTAAPVLRRVAFPALRAATAPAYERALARALGRRWGRPDVVHCWGGEHVNWGAGRAARDAGIPLVVTPFAHPGAWGDDERNAAFYRTADAVLALVPSEARFYERLGVAPERLHVVGVPVTPLPQDGPDMRVARALGDDPLVLYLGVKEPYKGYRVLLDAMREVWREVPRARVAFVGPRTEPSRRDFAAISDERVIEQGMVSDAEVASWLRAASVLCLPSTSEIMPVSIVEAWHAGIPVVAARWWCAADLIDHERTGLIVEPDAASVAAGLVAVLLDPGTLGAAGRASVAPFAPAAVAAAHEATYRAAGAS